MVNPVSFSNARSEEIFGNTDKVLLEKFKMFHQDNPHVYEAFRDCANVLWRVGRRKYSSRLIIDKIRWDYDSTNTGDLFKINNDFIAIYGRLLIYHEPKFADFFELRTMKPEKRHISAEERHRKKIHAHGIGPGPQPLEENL